MNHNVQAQMTLRGARTSLRMTQSQAAAAFGVHYQTLAKWETDNSRMPHNMIAKIPIIYGVSADHIFFGPENEFIRLSSADALE